MRPEAQAHGAPSPAASSLSLCWGEAARPAECCSGMDTSGGRGLAVLAGRDRGTLPGRAGSRVRTTGLWAWQGHHCGEGASVGLMWPRHHSDAPPPPRPKLTAAPHLVTLPVPPPDSPTQSPCPSPHTCTCAYTPSHAQLQQYPQVCRLTHGWAGTLGPVQSDLVLDARGKWSRGQIPGRHHPVVRWSVLQDCMGLP